MKETNDMTDYTVLPAYRDDTPRDAQFHYAQDLLREFCPLYGHRSEDASCCAVCAFPAAMSHNAKCCGWTVGARQEEAIKVLERLLGKKESA